jgi:ABC-type dipeptide/oligopeptide/nickel transport system ATPase component
VPHAALLSIRDLEISFRNGKKMTPAVSGVSFDVNAGEIVTLVGESGSGKSVTALSILGLLARQGKITGGEILFEGKNLLSLSPAELDMIRGKEIAMIFQDIMYSLNRC